MARTTAIGGAEARDSNRAAGHASQNCGPTVLVLSFMNCIPCFLDQSHLTQVVNVPVWMFYRSKVVGESRQHSPWAKTAAYVAIVARPKLKPAKLADSYAGTVRQAKNQKICARPASLSSVAA